ncbi:outer membrane protein transport protein [uncultured Thiodictyon sp.]|uniref:OmpP1/FadL family transporter n=1 Tax=uncultured Thiodictyon sp. TaxID=1846217 RepID=UPI0025F96F33|nr:outer membrane protein transport protein [uncultured Thiodictyon sp.]
MHSKIAPARAAALIAGVIGTLAAPGGALASGFLLPEASTAGIGTANAMVANPIELGAIPYNAAAMGFHDNSSLALGALMIAPSFSVNTASGNHSGTGATWVAGPMFQAAIKLNQNWRLGLGVTTPFGLETRWGYGTFPALSQSATIPLPPPLGLTTIPTGNHPATTKLEVLDFAPTGAYRVNDNLSLAAGMDIYWAKSAQLDSNLGQMSGDGIGLGFNLGAMYRIQALTLGLTYHSASTVRLGGNFTPLNTTLVMMGQLAQGQPASLNLDLPWRLQVGARYEFTKTFAAEFDWTYTGWSQFRQLVVSGDRTGGIISTETNNWNDASAFRLGLTWQVRPTTQLRCGYAYDQTGQGNGYFSARVPDSDRQTFSIGIAQGLSHGFSIEAGYMYVMGQKRNYAGGVPYSATSGVNGTTALNGQYEMSAHIVGIEALVTF